MPGKPSYDELVARLAAVEGELAQQRRLTAPLAALKGNGAELLEFFSATVDLLCIVDPQGFLRPLNEGWTPLLGFSAQELEGQRFLDLVDPRDVPTAQAALAQAEEPPRVHCFSTRFRAHDGTHRWVEWRSLRCGEWVYASGRDVTEHLQIEQALRDKEIRYQRLFDEAIVGIAIADAETGVFLDFNQAFLDLCGYERSELLGKPQLLLHPEEQSESGVSQVFALHRREKSGQLLESAIVTKSGQRKLLSVKGKLLQLDGRWVVQGFFRDVTEEVRSQRERAITQTILRLSEDRTRTHELVKALLESLQDWTGCEAVGMRLREGADFPYFETRGLPDDFVQLENSLCACDDRGEVLSDKQGPLLECFCGAVLRSCGELPRSNSTPRGSFWTNCASELLAQAQPSEIPERLRGRCIQRGFESIALIRLRQGETSLGLVQFNDHRKGRFTPELISFLEKLADQMAVALGQRLAETALRETEADFRRIVETAQEGIWVVDTNHITTFVNQRVADMLGYSPEEILGRSPTDFLFEEDIAAHLAARNRQRRGEPSVLERRFRRKNGDPLWAIVSAQGVLDDPKRLGHAFAMLTDITARKQAEEAIRKSEATLSVALNSAPQALILIDREGVVQAFNAAATARAELLGASSFQVGASLQDILTPSEFERFYSAFKEVLEGKTVHLERNETESTGKTYWLEYDFAPVRDAERRVLGVCAAVTDLTDRRLLEAQLLQAQKMESMGRLAGGVAHDFNNMLQVIRGYTEMILGQVHRIDPIRSDLLEIQQAVDRSADLIAQLLAFARKQPAAPRVLAINDLVSGLGKMFRRLISENIELRWLPGEEVWCVCLDPSQITQVLANLVVNARDAISGAGTITVQTANTVFDNDYCGRHAGFVTGQYVMISVSDTGVGLDPEIQNHLFEPFFTTKEPGRGTGLGLATVYGIVKQNQGFINVYSEPGAGTIFKIYLPRFDQAPEVPVRRGHDSAPPRGTETILLVEDEEPLLNLGKRILEQLGYRVLAARHPEDAISITELFSGEIHLLITDVVMPGMNGKQLRQRLSQIRPGIKCLYMSGYTAEVIAHSGVLEPGVHYIGKPFSLRELSLKVRQTLEH